MSDDPEDWGSVYSETNSLYMSGIREGLTWVLNHLNTYDTKLIDKRKLYETILEEKPEEIAKNARKYNT